MSRLVHLIAKETLLLARDANALLLLFAMPAMFILIMSLALQDRFAAHDGAPLPFTLVNLDSGQLDTDLLQRLDKLPGFAARHSDATPAQLRARVAAGQIKFLLVVPAGFGAALDGDTPRPLEVSVAADVAPTTAKLFQASLRSALGQLVLARALAVPNDEAGAESGAPPLDRLLATTSPRSHAQPEPLPSSVQQNVPAWLLFAMFFIAIPLSTTWVQERAQGTYLRLRSMGVPGAALLAGKLVPYVVLNLLQVVLMLAVGVFVLPWLGADALTLGHSWPALVLVAAAASFAAVAYALLVANLVASSEQATIFTGVANLLMAALGGIMVPRFVMPEAMQAISQYSPMAWGLDGFLDVFLRGGGVAMVADSLAKLVAFGLVCLLATALWMRYRRRA